MRFPRWRKMTWVLVIWCALILVWAVAGTAANDCANQTGDTFLSASDAQSACEAGTGIGVALVLLFGFFGFVFFAFIWLMTRPKGRDCPVCGNLVKKGRTSCASCGHDFAAAAHGSVPGAAQPQPVP